MGIRKYKRNYTTEPEQNDLTKAKWQSIEVEESDGIAIHPHEYITLSPKIRLI